MFISYREAFLGKRKLQDYHNPSNWINVSEDGGWTEQFMEDMDLGRDGKRDSITSSKIKSYVYVDKDKDLSLFIPSNNYSIAYGEGFYYYYNPELKAIVGFGEQYNDSDTQKILNYFESKIKHGLSKYEYTFNAEDILAGKDELKQI